MEIRAEYLLHYVPQPLGSGLFTPQVAGWTVGFVRTHLSSTDGTPTASLESIARVEDVWFEDSQAMRTWASVLTSGTAAETRRRIFFEKASSSFVSREYVLFRDGEPTKPA